MLQRRSYNPRLSFASFMNGEIVAFTLNGTGTFNGVPTAYDVCDLHTGDLTRIAVQNEYRRKGIGSRNEHFPYKQTV